MQAVLNTLNGSAFLPLTGNGHNKPFAAEGEFLTRFLANTVHGDFSGPVVVCLHYEKGKPRRFVTNIEQIHYPRQMGG